MRFSCDNFDAKSQSYERQKQSQFTRRPPSLSDPMQDDQTHLFLAVPMPLVRALLGSKRQSPQYALARLPEVHLAQRLTDLDRTKSPPTSD